MKILFLNHNLIWRGTFFRCFGFARELAKRGHSVDLWTVAREPKWKGDRTLIDGVRVWQTPRWGSPGKHDGGYAFLDNLSRLAGSIAGGWDCIHAFEHRPNVLLPWLQLRFRDRRLCRNAKSLFLADWSDWWAGGGIISSRRRFPILDRMEQQVEEWSKTRADGITVISSVLYQRAKDLGIDEKRLLLLPSGVSTDSFPALNREDCRRRLNLPLDRPLLGFIGFSLWDMNLLAEAFQRIQEKAPEAALLVIGGGVEEQAIDVFRRRFTLGRDILLPGVVAFSEVPYYLGACDIQLLPMENTLANRARLPNKLFDYYASGRPIVVTDLGDTGRWIREHQTGLAVETGAEAFAEACLHWLENAAAARACGERARRLAETEYSYAVQSERLLLFYDRISQDLDWENQA